MQSSIILFCCLSPATAPAYIAPSKFTMGRKKRKTPTEADQPEDLPVIKKEKIEQVPTAQAAIVPVVVPPEPAEASEDAPKLEDTATASSGYAMTAHGGDLVEDDVYVSDGSEDDEEIDRDGERSAMEIVLTSSRLGVMRRGLHHQKLVQQNRQWVRGGEKIKEEVAADGDGPKDDNAAVVTAEDLEERRRKHEEEELAKLDPVQRAARLLAEKQRKLEEAKELARSKESEENAGRDPCLFSKRTAFDIRMDQIEDKPWARGVGDVTDFFNYNMTEDDWVDYSQQQLIIRQELTDAGRQRRFPDPTIVPVTPRMPAKQNPRVAVAATDGEDDEQQPTVDQETGEKIAMGPALGKSDDTSSADEAPENVGSTTNKNPAPVAVAIDAGIGGAWGAGAAPGSVLARLIEKQDSGTTTNTTTTRPPATATSSQAPNHYQPQEQHQHHQQQQGGESSEYQENHREGMDTHQGGNQQWNDRNQQDWRSGGNNEFGGGRYNQGGGYGQQQQQQQHQQQQYPPRGGGFPGRGGPPQFSGRGGRGGFHGGRGRGGHDEGMAPPPWAGRGGRGGGGGYNNNYRNKRPREEYDGNDYRRG